MMTESVVSFWKDINDFFVSVLVSRRHYLLQLDDGMSQFLFLQMAREVSFISISPELSPTIEFRLYRSGISCVLKLGPRQVVL
jgi:hypothetical protein